MLVHIRLVLRNWCLLPNLLIRQGWVDKPSRPCMLAKLLCSLILLCLLLVESLLLSWIVTKVSNHHGENTQTSLEFLEGKSKTPTLIEKMAWGTRT